ncbi:MAG: glycoside hydrolase family 6 protein [Acidimicrobiales bacterium]
MSRTIRSLALSVSLVLAVLAGPVAGSAGGTTYPPNPFAGKRLFVDPSSNAARDAATLATVDPVRAGALRKIAGQSQADWYGDWVPTDKLASVVASRTSQITAAGAYPVLVAYAIPKRDCGSYSGGGATSPDAYRAWIKALKSGIGTRKAAVILEPDALAQLGCLSAADQQVRLTLLKEAVTTLAAGGNVAVYLDAGNAGWIPAATMAGRLAKAGVAGARGFSLNVSGFGWTADQIAYGRQIAPSIGWKRFVVDTSRNGLGPATGIAEPWCNPPGRALGAAPTTSTGDALVDALLWIKRPGESDGTCNGGPAAGQWWRDYAVGLAQRATW